MSKKDDIAVGSNRYVTQSGNVLIDWSKQSAGADKDDDVSDALSYQRISTAAINWGNATVSAAEDQLIDWSKLSTSDDYDEYEARVIAERAATPPPSLLGTIPSINDGLPGSVTSLGSASQYAGVKNLPGRCPNCQTVTWGGVNKCETRAVLNFFCGCGSEFSMSLERIMQLKNELMYIDAGIKEISDRVERFRLT